jgi:hypothetical protein
VGCGVRGTKNSEQDKNKKIDGEEEKKKKRQIRQKPTFKKKQIFFSQWCSGESTHDPNQEGSESRPLDHVNLRKGSI